MRILSVRPEHEEEDIAKARTTLDSTIQHPSTTVVVVRRVGPQISQFADKVASRTDPFPWRDSVWVTDQRIFRPGEEARLFTSHSTAAGAILDMNNAPAGLLEPDATIPEIEEAILEVEAGT